MFYFKYLYDIFISGYVRIVLAIMSFYYMPHDYVKAVSCYLLSGFLDAFDGHVARIFHQVNYYHG